MRVLRPQLWWLLGALLVPGMMFAQTGDLLTRIWDGVQRAQSKYKTVCGTVKETRTSLLLAKPMVLRGKFCAEGTARFALDYFEPNPLRIRFDGDYLNVTTGGGLKTEVLEVGSAVRHAQSYFSKENSISNLRKNFVITVGQNDGVFEMKLVPRSEAFRRRLNYVVVKLIKDNFFLRSLEVDGKSGVNSVFEIEVTTLNSPIPAGTFETYKPR